jgi:hypothetical protein
LLLPGAARGGGDEGAQIMESSYVLRAEEIQFVEAEHRRRRKGERVLPVRLLIGPRLIS